MLRCGDEQIKRMDGLLIRFLEGQEFTVGREGACRAVTVRSTKTWEETGEKGEAPSSPRRK